MEKVLLALGAIALLGATLYMTTGSEQVPAQTNLGVDPQVYDLYNDWKKKYNKKFASPDQDWYRLTVFNDNYNSIKEFYEQPDQTYTLDFNQFMDLTTQEFAETYLTLRVFETSETVIEAPLNGDIDWTQKGVVPEVKNQAACGSCWAFSAVGALETHSRIHRQQELNLSEQDLVDCSQEYGNYGCNGGLMDYAFQYVVENGLAEDTVYGKYAARDQACKKDVARDFKISGFEDVPTADCAALQAALENHPVSVAVDATTWQFYSGGVLTQCNKRLNHGVLLVGVLNGNWKVRNSWGTGWGEKGYINVQGGDTCGICQVASYPVL